MPMVWVDVDCDGTCGSAKEAARMERHLEHVAALAEQASLALSVGDTKRAAELLEAMASAHTVARHEREERLLQKLWQQWRDSPLPRQPFIEWAHSRRKD